MGLRLVPKSAKSAKPRGFLEMSGSFARFLQDFAPDQLSPTEVAQGNSIESCPEWSTKHPLQSSGGPLVSLCLGCQKPGYSLQAKAQRAGDEFFFESRARRSSRQAFHRWEGSRRARTMTRSRTRAAAVPKCARPSSSTAPRSWAAPPPLTPSAQLHRALRLCASRRREPCARGPSRGPSPRPGAPYSPPLCLSAGARRRAPPGATPLLSAELRAPRL